MGRMCDGKVRYESEEEAIRVLLIRSRDVGKLRYYKCPICKGYHLTSKIRNGGKNDRNKARKTR